MNPRLDKIALYQPYPHTMGGLQAVVLQLGRGLSRRGWNPLIICPEEGNFADVARKADFPVLVSDPGNAWHVYGRGDRTASYLFSLRRAAQLMRYWIKLSRELRQRQITLLHCNDYRAVMLAAPAARLAGIPIVWHMHGFIPSRLANGVAALLANRVAAVSRGMLDYFQTPRFLARKFCVIHNGLETFPEPSPAATGVPIVLAVGTLHPRKGYETLIRAFKQVIAQLPEAECHIIGGEFGDGSHARELRALAQSEGVAHRVRFRGYSAEAAAEMERCAILAIPSRVEAFGMVAIEAMAAGKPVVATRTGGLKDIVKHGETGFLVEEGDADGMGRCLAELLQEPARAARMGQAGRERVRREFTASKMISAFEGLYRRLSGPAEAPERQASVI
jgi:glycosyltransferase involved in cell wall biosynthesis